MLKKTVTFLFILLATNCFADNQPIFSANKTSVTFELQNPDYQKSPCTGMTRKHWIQAAEYLLDGAFSYIHCLDDPMYFPKQLDKTYPADEGAAKTAKLEGLARTLFIAAPLLRENPDLTLHGIRVKDYYHHQLVSISNPKSKHYIPHRTGGPSQTLLELGSLCISMTVAPDALWKPLSQKEKDDLAATMLSYGEGPSIGSNWMFFNVFIQSFLKAQGYKVDEKKMVDWLNKLLDRYRGEGWYNDAPAYDYYSMWAYQSYGPLWAEYYGKKFKPSGVNVDADADRLDADVYQKIAERITKNQHDMVDNYPYMFARDGRMNMWGRSICYRFAAVTPLPLLELGHFDDVNYGWMRSIASSSLLQFMQNPDFLENGVPTMGFYGPFAPAVQIYSCRGSVYWIGKAFLGLLLPESSKYWSAVENRGPWETVNSEQLTVNNGASAELVNSEQFLLDASGKAERTINNALVPNKVYNKFQPATGLMITDYPNSGAAEMRSWCHETVASDWQKFRSSENYNKLAYNTEFPWMADGKNGEISMNYGTKNKNTSSMGNAKGAGKGTWEVLRLYDFKGYKDGIYTREARLETDKNVRYQLNDITLPDGILRVDKVTVPVDSTGSPTTEVCLGHYALPEGSQYELAQIPLYGWTGKTEILHPVGLHPVTKTCTLPILRERLSGSRILITLQLWKNTKVNGAFTPKELSPVKSIKVSKDQKKVTILLANKQKKIVTFE